MATRRDKVDDVIGVQLSKRADFSLRPKSRAPFRPPRPQAMEVLDVQMAVHVYRQLGDAGMVMGLERIAYVEDKNLLAGHVALLFGNYQTAQVKKKTAEKRCGRSLRVISWRCGGCSFSVQARRVPAKK